MRPMLNNPKSDIYQFAHKYHVPYMKDTTPDWSCRGVIRRQIMPKLVGQYGEGINANLAHIGHQSRQWNSIVDSMILKPIMNSIRYSKDHSGYFELSIKPEMNQMPSVLWSKILVTAFHTMGVKMTSHGSIEPFILWLSRTGSREDCMFKFSNGFFAITRHGTLYVFSSRWTKAQILEKIKLISN